MQELNAESLANTLADKLLKIKAETLANLWILRHYCKRFYTVAELYVKKTADTECDVKALAPVDVLAYMLAWKNEETHAATPEVMCMLTH